MATTPKTYSDWERLFDGATLGTNGQRIYTYAEACAHRLPHSRFVQATGTCTLTFHCSEVLPGVQMGTPYLRTHLDKWMRNYVLPQVHTTRTGRVHRVMRRQGNDGRRQLPASLLRAVGIKASAKIEVKWVAAYLANCHPPATTTPTGQQYQGSHRCVNQNRQHQSLYELGVECIDAACLAWEDGATNQSRGNVFCTRLCNHAGCGLTICACQRIHDPPCV